MEKEIYEQANPVSKTAVTNLFMMANAGYQRAQTILEHMNIRTEDYSQKIDADNDLSFYYSIIREIRYLVLNRAMLETGIENIFDVPCGYTHRVLDVLAAGKNYIGGDLPPVIMSFAPVIEKMISPFDKHRAKFAVVDATSYDTMHDAVKNFDGPICITSEGLGPYLNMDEKERWFSNIYRLLSERGGCYLDADIDTLALFKSVLLSVARENVLEILEGIMNGFASQSDTNFKASALGLQKITPENIYEIRGGVDYDLVEKFCASCGLKAERVPYYREDLNCMTFKKMKPEELSSLKEFLKQVYIWKFTADDNFKTSDANNERGFNVELETREGKLFGKISGRIDSLTAPVFLKAWEDERSMSEITSAEIDCSALKYISSAGLRVLLLIQKSLKNSKLKLTGVNKDVREILDTTGFLEIFDV